MTNLTRDSAVTQIVELLTRYSFEIQGYTAQGVVAQWLTQYAATWVRLAVVEALYLGRYKAVSIEQILTCWRRRGNPKIHFDREFECLICCKLPQRLDSIPNSTRSNRAGQPGKKSYQRELTSARKPLYRAKSKVPSVTVVAPASKKLHYFAPPLTSSSLPLMSAKEASSATKVIEADIKGKEASSATEVLNADIKGKKASSATEVLNADIKRVEDGASKHSIDRFTPSPDASHFYFKLKAVAQQTTK